MFSKAKTPVEKQSDKKMGKVGLGDVAVDVPFQKLPNDSGYFLYFKLNDQRLLVNEGARLIAERFKTLGLENPYFVTPEASTLALAHVLRDKYDIDGLTIYKKKQINDVDPFRVEYDVVTATDKQQLFLCREKAELLKDKNIIILDSITTTGGTVRGVYNLLVLAGVPEKNIVEATMLFTEGEERKSVEVRPGKHLSLHSFSHMPIVKTLENENALKL